MSAADLICLADPSDPIAKALVAKANRRGLRMDVLTLSALASTVTVERSAAPVLHPALPLLIRPVALPVPGGASDDQFLWSEHFATTWAYGALNPCPVINRPGERGLAGRVSSSGYLTGSVTQDPKAVCVEMLWSRLAPPSSDGAYHQNLETWQTTAVDAVGEFGRTRLIDDVEGWEVVVVVGDKGWRSTSAQVDHDLEAESIAAVAALGLSFAAVAWAVRRDAPPVLTRVNPFPTWHECVQHLPAVCDALLDSLTTAVPNR